jgi:6-phosphogluconolactonase/glucosamine-6-phosphate isomerase/deaminase
LIWLVTGEEKRDALDRLLRGDPSIPAGRVRNEEMTIVADAAAAGAASAAGA